MGSQGIHLNEPARFRPVGRAATPAWRGRKRSLGHMLVVAWTVASVWATLACGAGAEERLLRDYAECLVDSNSALHRRHVESRIGTIPLSPEGMERSLIRQLERGTLTMGEITNNYSRHCD